MIKKIIEKVENEELYLEDAKYLLFTDDDCINRLYRKSIDVNRKDFDEIILESKIFYPLVYSIRSNCPTCGYQTPESHRQYNTAYIESVIKYNIDVIKSYGVDKINCLCIDNNKDYEKELFLKILDEHDIDKHIKINNIQELEYMRKYDFSSLIIDSENTKVLNFLKENNEVTNEFQITANVKIYSNNMKNNIKFINNIKSYGIDEIEIVGYDPFYDDIHEYNPQYTKEYAKRVISILRIMYPKLKLKISYATNGRNYFEDIIPLGINSINGIYCNKTNKLYNIEDIKHILQKIDENAKK